MCVCVCVCVCGCGCVCVYSLFINLYLERIPPGISNIDSRISNPFVPTSPRMYQC